MSSLSCPFESSFSDSEIFGPLHVTIFIIKDLNLSMEDGFFKSDSLLTRSLLTDIYSKFSISTDMNKFNKMNYPIIIREKKKKVAING